MSDAQLDASYTDSTEIFLLMSKKSPAARGFYDAGGKRAFTFAFTTQDKAHAFIREARRLSLLLDVDMLYKITIGEFFEWKETGRTSSELSIDPHPETLSHPVFFEAQLSAALSTRGLALA